MCIRDSVTVDFEGGEFTFETTGNGNDKSGSAAATAAAAVASSAPTTGTVE